MENKKINGGSQYKTNGKSHYERNKQKYVEASARRKSRNRSYIRNLKMNGSCVDCNISDWRVLDYDHKPDSGKLFNVAQAVEMGHSIERIDAEIQKCELRCANCHRIITLSRAGIV